MQIIKDIVISEFENGFGEYNIKDITFQQILDLKEKHTEGIKLLIVEIHHKFEKLTMKLVSCSPICIDCKLYMNDSYVGVIDDTTDLNEYFKSIINLLKSVI